LTTPLALISDVHGNFPAFCAVLAEIERLGIQRIISLGDTVGYGPQPVECLEMAIDACHVMLMGNHELRVLDPSKTRMNRTAALASDWTRDQLEQAHLIPILKTLPKHYQEDELLFVHGTPKDTLRDYLMEQDYMGYSNFDKIVQSLEEDFKNFRLCFVGHNHLPFLATEDGFIHPHDGQRQFQLEDRKLYVSVGSVGQPRDRDPRASFVTYDGESVQFHRVSYDIEATRAKFLVTDLPEYLSNRLLEGR